MATNMGISPLFALRTDALRSEVLQNEVQRSKVHRSEIQRSDVVRSEAIASKGKGAERPGAVPPDFGALLSRLKVANEEVQVGNPTAGPRNSTGDLKQGVTWLEEVADSWERSERRIERLIEDLPVEGRGLIEAQVAVNELQLKTELLTRAADGVSSGIKRVQQMGGGS